MSFSIFSKNRLQVAGGTLGHLYSLYPKFPRIHLKNKNIPPYYSGKIKLKKGYFSGGSLITAWFANSSKTAWFTYFSNSWGWSTTFNKPETLNNNLPTPRRIECTRFA